MSFAADIDDRPLTLARERFERIYNTIRDRICLIEYEPGARLGEEELAREFGVSRTPVRRVLVRLEGEGLLESRHGVGTFVIDVDLEALLPVYRLRMELAALMGKLDPLPRSPEDLARVRALLGRCDQLIGSPDPRAYARLNMDFFHELAAMIGNGPLREISERLYFLTNRVWLRAAPLLDLSDEVAVFRREVADILAAMELGDWESVGYIRRSHIAMWVRRMQQYQKAPE
ncbi:MAG: GntR family transcriptional regulator [Alphaproteobacteria bacterium]|nr:MAG: GntR family transcriptional regulator [Alphaproteobacteria bacterium]